MEKYGRVTDGNIIRLMRFACWVTKATDTLEINNNYCLFTTTMLTRKRLNVALYVHCCSVNTQVQFYDNIAHES